MIGKRPKEPKWDEVQDGRADGTEDHGDLEWDQYGGQSAAQGALIWFCIVLACIAWLAFGKKFP